MSTPCRKSASRRESLCAVIVELSSLQNGGRYVPGLVPVAHSLTPLMYRVPTVPRVCATPVVRLNLTSSSRTSS
jgi:hypothetical protein